MSAESVFVNRLFALWRMPGGHWGYDRDRFRALLAGAEPQRIARGRG